MREFLRKQTVLAHVSLVGAYAPRSSESVREIK
jgi:hypothetical protein